MTEQDIIKKNALEKLDELVKGSLNYLKDNNMTLDQFSIKVDNFFSNEEFLEIRNCLKQLLKPETIVFYCNNRNINSPVIEKYKEMIENTRNNRSNGCNEGNE